MINEENGEQFRSDVCEGDKGFQFDAQFIMYSMFRHIRSSLINNNRQSCLSVPHSCNDIVKIAENANLFSTQLFIAVK